MDRYVVWVCAGVLVSATSMCHGQAAASTNKPKTAVTTPVPPARPKASDTNTVSRSANNVVSRVHMKIGKETEPEFLQLVNDRRTTTEEVRTIKRLISEKQAGLEKIDVQLAASYFIKDDRNYHYDVQAKTIYEITGGSQDTNTAGKTGTAPAGGVLPTGGKKIHLVLDGKEKADKFVQLTAAKQLASTTIRVLLLLDQEKESELARQNGALLERFGMSRDRSYEYDPGTGTLYELIPVPGAGKSVNR